MLYTGTSHRDERLRHQAVRTVELKWIEWTFPFKSVVVWLTHHKTATVECLIIECRGYRCRFGA